MLVIRTQHSVFLWVLISRIYVNYFCLVHNDTLANFEIDMFLF